MRGAADAGWTHLRIVDDFIPKDAHSLWRRYARLAKRAGVELNFHCASISDGDEATVALEGATAVYHLDEIADYRGGCFRSARIHRVNVEGTASVLRCCARGARIVFVSSTAAAHPAFSAYGASKAAAERLVAEAERAGEVRALIVARPSSAVVGGAAAVLTHAARPMYVKNLASFIAHAGVQLEARPTELSGTRHTPCDALRCAPRTLWQLARAASAGGAAPGRVGGAADAFAPLPLCVAWALVSASLLPLHFTRNPSEVLTT